MSDNAKTWAQRTKEATAAANQLKQVSGGGTALEAIATYYQANKPGPNSKLGKMFQVGEPILGIYEGSFTTKAYGTRIYKVRTANEGLVGLTGTGQLNSKMGKVAVGAEVSVTYNGKVEIKTGPQAGRLAHNFDVAASDLIEAA